MSRTWKSTRTRRITGAAIACLLVGGLAAYHFRPADYANGWPAYAAEPNSLALARAAESVVAVLACSRSVCNTDPVEPFDLQVKRLASGWVVSPGRVVTTAHLVAGSHSAGVQVGGTGRVYQATVVIFDPARDLAVLAVPGLPAAALYQAAGVPLHRQDPAVITGYMDDGDGNSYTAKSTVLIEYGRYDAPGDRLNGQETYRLAFFGQHFAGEFGLPSFGLNNLDGGPLLDGQGDVVGIGHPSQGDTGLALTLAAAKPVLDAAAGASTPVSTGTVEMSRRTP